MADCVDKNMIDKDEYPQTAELERRCLAMLADLPQHLHFTPTSRSSVNLISSAGSKSSPTNGYDARSSPTCPNSSRRSRPGATLERRPFTVHLTRPAEEIIEKVRRGRAALNRQTNSTTEH